MKRRQFIKASGIGVLTSSSIIFSSSILHSCSSVDENGIIEEKRNIPVKGKYDVIVCGSGPAGVTAAIEAAKKSASVLLIETHGCLGGIWTSGLLCWILDYKNKKGFLKQMIEDLRSRDAVCPIPTDGSLSFDIEEMKLLLEDYCADTGVNVRLHTRVVGAVKNDNRLTHVITESPSGREAWYGKMFIDATGDGNLAALAGCGFDYGDAENDSAAQPASLLSLISGVNFEEIKDYVRWEGDTGSGSKKLLLDLIEKGGYNSSYKKPSIHPVREDLFMLMANHEYGCKGFDADNLTKSTMQARKELNQIVKALRRTGKAWENLRIVTTAEQIGIREGRRIHGLYTVTVQDVIEGRRHEDAVCRATFGVDVHPVVHSDEIQKTYSRGYKTQPYDIPLRALISKDVSGLMMAGRCISGDFLTHASYRVTGNAVPMGEAAGKVAAFAALNGVLPQDVPNNAYQVFET